MLERNANLEDSDKDGMTPVMVAAELGRADNLGCNSIDIEDLGQGSRSGTNLGATFLLGN